MPSDGFEVARAKATALGVTAKLLLPPDASVTEELEGGDLEREIREAGRRLELPEADALADALGRERTVDRAGREAAYMRLFGPTVGRDNPPYSTEYEPDAGFRKEQDLADIAGFYRAFGLLPADGLAERPDHFGIEADFLAFLCLKEAVALAEDDAEGLQIVRSAAGRFAAHYLGPAVRTFGERLARSAPDSAQTAAAALLAALADGDAGGPAASPPSRRVVALPVVS